MPDKMIKRVSVNWYAVKVLFGPSSSVTSIFRKREPGKAAGNKKPNNSKLFAESIFLVKATNPDQANYIVEDLAKQTPSRASDLGGDSENMEFVRILHTFELPVRRLKLGTEVYSRYISVPRGGTELGVLARYYPEALDEESSPRISELPLRREK